MNKTKSKAIDNIKQKFEQQLKIIGLSFGDEEVLAELFDIALSTQAREIFEDIVDKIYLDKTQKEYLDKLKQNWVK